MTRPQASNKGTKLGPLPWGANRKALTWQLIHLAFEPENYRVLFGKKSKQENTSGERKISVYKRIGGQLFPEQAAVEPMIVADRTMSKMNSLIETYKEKAKLLRQTGGGIGDGTIESERGDGAEERLQFYIGPEGPDDTTPSEAQNLWDQILREFEFFPAMHKVLSTRPNVTPICLTTGVGPHGRQTVFIQPVEPAPPIEDDEPSQVSEDPLPSDPARSQPSATPARTSPAPDSTASRSFGTVNGGNHLVKPVSTSAQDRLEKAKTAIQKLPAKRGFDVMLLEMHQTQMASNERYRRLDMYQREREQLLSELREGIWTKEEYKEMLEELKVRFGQDAESAPKKRTRRHSPDWDENVPGSDTESL